MITQLKNRAFLPLIKPLIEKVEFSPYPPEDYYNYINEHLDKEDCVVMVDVNNAGQLTSMAFLEVILSVNEREAMIDLAYFDPHTEGIGQEFADKFIEWAKLRKCNKISALVDDTRSSAYIKKYGFTVRYSYLSKEIEEVTDEQKQGSVSN